MSQQILQVGQPKENKEQLHCGLVTLPVWVLPWFTILNVLRNIPFSLVWQTFKSQEFDHPRDCCVQLGPWKVNENSGKHQLTDISLFAQLLWNDHDAFGWPSFITPGFVCWPRKDVDVELTVLHYFAWGLMTFCGQTWYLPTCNVRFFALQVMYQSWIGTIKFKAHIFSLWPKQFS